MTLKRGDGTQRFSFTGYPFNYIFLSNFPAISSNLPNTARFMTKSLFLLRDKSFRPKKPQKFSEGINFIASPFPHKTTKKSTFYALLFQLKQTKVPPFYDEARGKRTEIINEALSRIVKLIQQKEKNIRIRHGEAQKNVQGSLFYGKRSILPLNFQQSFIKAESFHKLTFIPTDSLSVSVTRNNSNYFFQFVKKV